MHAFFMACETCHIRPEKDAAFRLVWYDKTSGKYISKIDLSRFLANTLYKLIPLNLDGTRVYDSDPMKKNVTDFKSTVWQMAPAEKRAALDMVHRPMTEIKATVRCEECHTSDRNRAYLPFQQIGFSQRRANQLAENEVVGMLNKYQMFYIPDLLKPKHGGENGN
jgi:hypothetical protein